MKRVLITGATGNVGIEIIQALNDSRHSLEVLAGCRNIGADRSKLDHTGVSLVNFDFTDVNQYYTALANCDILFLVRVPAISNIDSYFKPLIDIAVFSKVSHIVFLSVMGPDILWRPFRKVESIIAASGIPCTIIRSAWFMQNFTTVLQPDLARGLVFLPAGKSKFPLIDVRDVAGVAAAVFVDPERHAGQRYELTNNEQLSFGEMSACISRQCGIRAQFEDAGLIEFYSAKREQGLGFWEIMAMIRTYYLVRFFRRPRNTDTALKLTGNVPRTFEQFVTDHISGLVPARVITTEPVAGSLHAIGLPVGIVK